MSSSILVRTRWAIAIAVVFALAAMVRYPGGHPLDPTSNGYSITHNFLSDLGMTVAYDGHPNRLGAGFFITSVLVLVVGLGTWLGTADLLSATRPAARWWARLAGVVGLFACAAFVGVALTPENRVMVAHVGVTRLAWQIAAAVACLMALTSARSDLFGRRVVLLWTLLALVLLGYVAILEWGPRVTTSRGLEVQVIAQKLAVAVVIAAVALLSVDVDRVQRRLSSG